MSNAKQLPDKDPDSGKITSNLGFVDLDRIDPSVVDGFYSNRTDFIRIAIRNQLVGHVDMFSKSIQRHSMKPGVRAYCRVDQKASQDEREIRQVTVVELARIDPEIAPDLALATIESITVLGGSVSSPARTSSKHLPIASNQRCITLNKD